METNEGRLARRLRESSFVSVEEARHFIAWFEKMRSVGVTHWDRHRHESAQLILEAERMLVAPPAQPEGQP